jgi:hypothetical protein
MQPKFQRDRVKSSDRGGLFPSRYFPKQSSMSVCFVPAPEVGRHEPLSELQHAILHIFHEEAPWGKRSRR